MKPIDAMVKNGLLYLIIDQGHGNLLGVAGTIDDMQMNFLRSYEPLTHQAQAEGFLRLRLCQFVVKDITNWKNEVPQPNWLPPNPRLLSSS